MALYDSPLYALMVLVVCGVAILLFSVRRHLVAVLLAIPGLVLIAFGFFLELLRTKDLTDAMSDDITCLIINSKPCELSGSVGFAGLNQWAYDAPFVLGSLLLLVAFISFLLSSYLRKRREQAQGQQDGPLITSML